MCGTVRDNCMIVQRLDNLMLQNSDLEALEIPPEELESIYQVVLEEAPEFNVEKIYRKILEGRQ